MEDILPYMCCSSFESFLLENLVSLLHLSLFIITTVFEGCVHVYPLLLFSLPPHATKYNVYKRLIIKHKQEEGTTKVKK